MMIRLMTVVSLAAGACISPVIAGESPNTEERAKIEAVLRSQGFTRWGEIEAEDGVF